MSDSNPTLVSAGEEPPKSDATCRPSVIAKASVVIGSSKEANDGLGLEGSFRRYVENLQKTARSNCALKMGL